MADLDAPQDTAKPAPGPPDDDPDSADALYQAAVEADTSERRRVRLVSDVIEAHLNRPAEVQLEHERHVLEPMPPAILNDRNQAIRAGFEFLAATFRRWTREGNRRGPEETSL